jgi:hypothetical protein
MLIDALEQSMNIESMAGYPSRCESGATTRAYIGTYKNKFKS